MLGQVRARQKAQQIRAYVDEVIASRDAAEGRAFEGERDAWARWARTVADQLDPLAPASKLMAAGYLQKRCVPNSS